MKYSLLGNSGLQVSSICLGTMMFGDQTTAKEAQKIVNNAWENGVNYIDTADQYSSGESERIVGKLINSARDWWILATKVGNPMNQNNPNEKGLSRKWILSACDLSLKRLGVDYIDIYYAHLDYENTPASEIVMAMGDLIKKGKIRYFGLSNFKAWRIVQIINECDKLSIPRPITIQPLYNILNRDSENEIFPACNLLKIGVTSYSSIARGVLTGKYKNISKPSPKSRAGRKDPRILETEFRKESIEIAKKIFDHSKKRGVSAIHFSVAWVLANKIVTSIIAGPKNLEQMLEYYKAFDVEIDFDDEKLVDKLVPKGSCSTHGFVDPRYPIVGRYLD